LDSDSGVHKAGFRVGFDAVAGVRRPRSVCAASSGAGFVTALFESEQTPAEAFLLSGDDIPADQELLNQLMDAEER
jgi:hypothetical protein